MTAACDAEPEDSPLDDETIARARSALTTMTSLFDEAMDNDVSALNSARMALHTARPTAELVQALLTRATTLEAQGNHLDVPLVTALAGSLQTLIGAAPGPSALPLELVDAHVDALKALGGQKRLTNPQSAELVRLLRISVRRTVDAWRTAAA